MGLVVTNPADGVGTRYIGMKQAAGAFHATRFARDCGQPINLGVVLNWTRLGVEPDYASRIFSELCRRTARRWTYLRKTAAPDLPRLAYISVQENPDGHRNTHWNVSIPPAYAAEFRRTVAARLRKLVGVASLGRGLRFVRIETAGGYTKYCLKGVLPAGASHFHMRAVDQGFIGGRGRVTVSRTIGRTARKAAGWSRKRRPRPAADHATRPD